MIIFAKSRVVATDSEDDAQNIGVLGAGQDILKTGNLKQQELLENILLELKKINTYFSIVTDSEVKEEDILEKGVN